MSSNARLAKFAHKAATDRLASLRERATVYTPANLKPPVMVMSEEEHMASRGLKQAAGGVREPADAAELNITEARNPRGYSDISTVYAYYTAAQKAEHGKHCEWWTDFGHRPETAPYRTGKEREFIAKIDAENPGKFGSYLITWEGCD